MNDRWAWMVRESIRNGSVARAGHSTVALAR